MATKTFDFTDGVSGRIQKSGTPATYTATTGYAAVRIQKNPTPSAAQWRGFMQFLTGTFFSGLGGTISISLVELYLKNALAQPGNPPTSENILIGNWIGSSLDGSQADYDGGNQMLNFSGVSCPPADGWYDLANDGYDPIPYIALGSGGTTDIALRDDTFGSLVTTGRDYNQNKTKCQLRVTYTSTVEVGASITTASSINASAQAAVSVGAQITTTTSVSAAAQAASSVGAEITTTSSINAAAAVAEEVDGHITTPCSIDASAVAVSGQVLNLYLGADGQWTPRRITERVKSLVESSPLSAHASMSQVTVGVSIMTEACLETRSEMDGEAECYVGPGAEELAAVLLLLHNDGL